MIISVDGEEAFEKSQHLCVIKTLNRLDVGGTGVHAQSISHVRVLGPHQAVVH